MKRNILFLGLTAMLFAACGENPYDDWANPQSSSEEAKSVQLAVSPASAIDLAAVTGDSIQLFVPTVTADGDVATTYTVTLYNEDETATQTITATENGMVSVADLEAAYYNLVGRKPVQRTIRVDVKAYTNVNGESVVNNASTTATLTANAPVLSSAYYIVGGALDWAGSAASKKQKFSHSDADPYDDPVFTIVIPAAASGDTWFAIATEEACDAVGNGDWSQLFGTTNGDGGVNGINVTERYDYRYNLGHDCSFKVPKSTGAKYIRVTINVLDQTYLIEPLNFAEFIYEIGNESGWGTSHALYGAKFDGNYLGYYYLNGEFKFKPNKDDWTGDWENDGEGKIADIANGPNCPDPGAGYYRISVNLADMTYSLMKVNQISMIGTIRGNWDTDVDLTYNPTTDAWEYTGELNAGEVKFRVNHDWTYSWGGKDGNAYNFDNLTENDGKNLKIDEAGTYKVSLTVHQEKDDCKVTFTKQ